MTSRKLSKFFSFGEESRSFADEIAAAEKFEKERLKMAARDSERYKSVRRYWFSIDKNGDVGPSLGPSKEDSNKLKHSLSETFEDLTRTTSSPLPQQCSTNIVDTTPKTLMRKTLQYRIVPTQSDSASPITRSASTSPITRPGSTSPIMSVPSHSGQSSPLLSPESRGGLRYYSVLLTDDDLAVLPHDYSRDYRRYAYRDFSMDSVRVEGNIDPEDMLKWLVSAKPRNQDDVVPIMQLCKAVLKDLMDKKISCRQKFEGSLRAEIANLRSQLKEKETANVLVKTEIQKLQEEAKALSLSNDSLKEEIARLKELQNSQAHEKELAQKELQAVEFANKISEIVAKNEELEKKLHSANIIAEMRTKEFFRAHNALSARMQMTSKEIVATWTSEEQLEGLRCLVQEHQKCIEKLQPADFQPCTFVVRQTLAKKLLKAMRVASTSWLSTVSEVFDCRTEDFLGKVLTWYKQENVLTDSVKYEMEFQRLKYVLDGTDLEPVYEIFRQGLSTGKYSVQDLIFSCSGMSANETAISITGMTLDEIQKFRDNREAIIKFIQTKQSTEVRSREEQKQKMRLGFLHNASSKGLVEPMEVSSALTLVGKVLARKFLEDGKTKDGEKRLNIMHVTRNVLQATYSAAEMKINIASLVKCIEVNAASHPRLNTFKILSGMDSSKPWFERPSAFMRVFILGVVDRIWADHDLMVDYAKQNYLPRPDLGEHQDGDHVGWFLTDYDAKVPIEILLKSAIEACEVHPCGYGYERDKMQKIVAKACNPTAEYVAFQEERLHDAKKRLKQLRAKLHLAAEENRIQAVMERLAKPDKRRPPVLDNLQEGPESSDKAATPKSLPGRKQHKWPGAEHQEDTKSPKGLNSFAELGVSFDADAKAWFDIFCCELLLLWFEQHGIVEAQLTKLFDESDKDGNGSLSQDEFIQMICKSPLKDKYSEKQFARIYSELTVQEGLMTKRDWLSLFHHVEFDVFNIIRDRRPVQKIVKEEALSLKTIDSSSAKKLLSPPQKSERLEELAPIVISTKRSMRLADKEEGCKSPLSAGNGSPLTGSLPFAQRSRSKSPVLSRAGSSTSLMGKSADDLTYLN